MSEELKELIEKCRNLPISLEAQEEQRRSFAFGNTHFENERITRKTVDEAAEKLKNGKKD